MTACLTTYASWELRWADGRGMGEGLDVLAWIRMVPREEGERMSNLKGEILFNRALLWLLLAHTFCDNKVLYGTYMLFAVYNCVRSLFLWGDGE